MSVKEATRSPDVFFAEQWPDVSRSIGRHLAGIGVPAQDVDDVLQETALRLYRSWSGLDPDRPVGPFARTVAVNVWRDRWRHSRDREVLSDDVPEPRAAVEDVADTVVARLELRRVGRALRQLPVRQQRLVRGAMEHDLAPEGSAPVPAVLRMARMRARRSLALCLQTASAVVAALVGWGRRIGGQASLAPSMALAGFVLAIGLGAVAVGGPSAPVAVPGTTALADAAATSRQATPAVEQVTRPPRVTAAAPRRTSAKRPSTTAPPPFVIDTPVAQAGAAVEVEVAGRGARVSGDGYPVCVFGVDPAGRAGLACRTNGSGQDHAVIDASGGDGGR